MRIPIFTIIILIFVVWLQYEIRKSSHLSKKDTNHFWVSEKESNLTRRQELSDLNLFTITTKDLPMEDNPDETVNSYRDTILKLTDKKMINLSKYSNTELKLIYGAANLNILTEYESHYIAFVSISQKWAERLYANGNIEEATAVLEYAVSCQTDVIKSYRLLAEIYKNRKTPEKINPLITQLQAIAIHDKAKLIKELTELKTS